MGDEGAALSVGGARGEFSIAVAAERDDGVYGPKMQSLLRGAFVFDGALAWVAAALLLFAARDLVSRRL